MISLIVVRHDQVIRMTRARESMASCACLLGRRDQRDVKAALRGPIQALAEADSPPEALDTCLECLRILVASVELRCDYNVTDLVEQARSQLAAGNHAGTIRMLERAIPDAAPRSAVVGRWLEVLAILVVLAAAASESLRIYHEPIYLILALLVAAGMVAMALLSVLSWSLRSWRTRGSTPLAGG
jgi:hypothetical protein